MLYTKALYTSVNADLDGRLKDKLPSANSLSAAVVFLVKSKLTIQLVG